MLHPNGVPSNYYGNGSYPLGRNDQGGDPIRIAAIQGLDAFPSAVSQSVPELVRLLREDKDPRVRWFTAGTIAELGPKAKDAVPALIDALRSREVAAGGRVMLGIGAMTDEDGPIRLAAAVALGKIGPAARSAVPALVQALADPDSRVRGEAAAALGEIGPDAAKAVSELARLSAGGGDDPVADLATQALGELKAAAVPALTEVLRRGSQEARVRVMKALGEVGSLASAAIPDLARALADSDEEIRTAAIEALGKVGIGPEAAVAVPHLLDALKDPDRHVRQHAAEGLGKIGPKSDQVIPGLIGAMKDRDHDVRLAASGALEVIGMPAFPALRAMLRDGDPELRNDAARALSRIAKIKAHDRPEDETDHQARVRAQAVRSALFVALKDPDERIRAGASRALGYVGKEVVPDLVLALEDRSPLVRLQAVRALGFIGNKASSALGPVRRRLDDSAPEVRGAAEATIKAILESDP